MPRKHIILTLGRSGSNTLVDMLNQNPAVLNLGEVLGDWNRIRKVQTRLRLFSGDDAAYLDALLGSPRLLRAANGYRNLSKRLAGKSGETKRHAGIQTVGFKDFSLNFERRGLLDYLRPREDIQVIGLARRNVLARMISNAVLQATGVVSSKTPGAGAGTRPRLTLDPDRVLGQLETIETENRVLQEMLESAAPGRRLLLDYEDLYSGEERTRETMQRVYAFLGVPQIVPTVRMTKLASPDPLEAVENAAEIRARLRGTRFETFTHGA